MKMTSLIYIILLLSLTGCGEAFKVISPLTSSSPPEATIETKLQLCKPNAIPDDPPFRRLTARETTKSLQYLFRGILTPDFVYQKTRILERESASTRLNLVFDTYSPTMQSFDEVSSISEVALNMREALMAFFKKGGGTFTTEQLAARQEFLGECFLSTNSTIANSADCAKTTIRMIGKRFYRRPLTDAELASMYALYTEVTSVSHRIERIPYVVEYLTQTPGFVYRMEGADDSGKGIYSLNAYERATRLSFALLGRTPHESLLAAADSGDIMTPEGLKIVVEELMLLPEAKENLRAFYSQWLRLDGLERVEASNEVLQGVNMANLRKAAIEEVQKVMDEVLWENNGKYPELFRTRSIYPSNTDLAAIHGVTMSATKQEALLTERGGILTLPALLMTSTDGAANPITRGVRILSDILCQEMGPPPDAAFGSIVNVDPLSSTRHQFEIKTAGTSCMGCHSSINPLGFSLGNYDGVGRFRTSETVTWNSSQAVHSIDAAVDFKIDDQPLRKIASAMELQEQIAVSRRGPLCMALRYYQFVNGRNGKNSDGCVVDRMAAPLLNTDPTSVVEMIKSYFLDEKTFQRRAKVEN